MIENISNTITNINKFFARNIVILFIYLMIFVMAIEVLSRYFFGSPTFFAYDLAWMFYSSFAVLGGAYTLIENAHVSADVFYKKMSDKKKAIVSIACYLIFFFPEIIGLTYSSFTMAIKSIKYKETSVYTNWGPSLIPIKIILFLGITLLLFQGIVKFAGYVKILMNQEEKKNES